MTAPTAKETPHSQNSCNKNLKKKWPISFLRLCLLLTSLFIIILLLASFFISQELEKHQIHFQGLNYNWSQHRLNIDALHVGDKHCAFISTKKLSIARPSFTNIQDIYINADTLHIAPECINKDASPRDDQKLTLPRFSQKLSFKIKYLAIDNFAELNNIIGQMNENGIEIHSNIEDISRQTGSKTYAHYLNKPASLDLSWQAKNEAFKLNFKQEQGLTLKLEGQLATNAEAKLQGRIHGSLSDEELNIDVPITLLNKSNFRQIAIEHAQFIYKKQKMKLKLHAQLDSNEQAQLELVLKSQSPSKQTLQTQLYINTPINENSKQEAQHEQSFIGSWGVSTKAYDIKHIYAILPTELQKQFPNELIGARLNSSLSGQFKLKLKKEPFNFHSIEFDSLGKLSIHHSQLAPKLSFIPTFKFSVLPIEEADNRNYKIQAKGQLELIHNDGSHQYQCQIQSNTQNKSLEGKIVGTDKLSITWGNSVLQTNVNHELSLKGTLASPIALLKSAKAQLNFNWHEQFYLQSELELDKATHFWPMEQRELSLSGSLTEMHWQGKKIKDAQVQLFIKPYSSMEAKLDWQPGLVNISFAPNDLKASIKSEDLAISTFEAFFPDELKVSNGLLQAQLTASLNQKPQLPHQVDFSSKITIEALSGIYNDMPLIALNAQAQIQGNEIEQTISGQLNVDEFNPGLSISDIQSHYELQFNEGDINLHLNKTSAKLLGGKLSSEHIHYPSEKPNIVNLQNLELLHVSQLQADPAILLEGRIDARLPLKTNLGHFSIEKGKLRNRGLAKMEVLDKRVLEQYIENYPELEFAIRPLEKLDIHQLSASIDLSNEGEMLLDAKVHGENAQQPQPLHLNYSHQENLYDLLNSIRLSDAFQAKIEALLNKQKDLE